MKKVLFSKELDDRNIQLRDYLLGKFSKYVDLDNCDLLEIGCGNGRFATLLGPKIRSYTGVEPDEEYLRIAKETTPKNAKAEYYKGMAEQVPLTKKFDIILYAFSWHFIQDFDKAINEAKRLLNQDGIMVIYEPSKETKKWASSKLTRGSKDFDKKLYQKKLSDLARGRKGISRLEKHALHVVEEQVDKGESPNLWIVKQPIRKSNF